MVDTVPPWLEVARKYLGVEEDGGAGSNPTILKFVSTIAAAFPDQAEYASLYQSDDTAWCGVFEANCFAECGIRAPFDPGNDEASWMFANAWQRWGKQSVARVGCVVCFNHHVGFLNRIIDAETFEVLGGNQSSPEGGAVTLSRRRRSEVVSMRWPDETAVAIPVRPEVELGSTGSFVVEVQRLLRVQVTGIFDNATDAAVRAFQASRGLEVDGIVGEETWPALLAAAGKRGLPQDAIDKIVALAGASELARYSWADRGVAPPGYIKGMAVTFAVVYAKLKAGDPSARVMTQPLGDEKRDALAWYGPELLAVGIGVPLSPPEYLRQLFVLLIGLGMRESSGRYCEGRDQSAANTTADTAEAGLFQQSFNSRSASPQILMLMSEYLAASDDGFFSIFKEGVTPQPKDLANFGSGDGEVFQRTCKTRPAFAVEAAAAGLRVLRQHWGPINRHEAEVRPEADRLLSQIQTIVDALPIEGEVIPPISRNDMMLMLLIFILSEEKIMDPNTRAQLVNALNNPNTDMRTLLLKVLGGGPADIEQPKPAPPPPPQPQPQALGEFDIGKFMPLLQNGTVQKILTAVPLTELLSLIPLVQAIIRGGAIPVQPVLTGPAPVQPVPVTPVPVSPTTLSPGAVNLQAGILGLLGSLGLSATGVMGAPIGPDATTTGMLVPLLTMGAAALGIPAPIVTLVSGLFSRLTAKK